MNKNSVIVKVMVDFGIYAAIAVGLIFLFRMPTTPKMNFAFLGYSVGSGLALLLAFGQSRLYWLCTVVFRGSQLMVIIGAIALAIFIFCAIGKFNLPFLPQQWYGVFLANALVAASLIKDMKKALRECKDEYAIEYPGQ